MRLLLSLSLVSWKSSQADNSLLWLVLGHFLRHRAKQGLRVSVIPVWGQDLPRHLFRKHARWAKADWGPLLISPRLYEGHDVKPSPFLIIYVIKEQSTLEELLKSCLSF